MLVANTFDLWQRDAFFSAAEEVQQSADVMESAYRTWLRARREGSIPQHLEELRRELQMSLGTAKWQLEEFEKAARLSYRNNGDDITIARHRQFASAIEDQVSRVETALKESLNVERSKPFRWVNLDEEECNDLALFLSGTLGASRRMKDVALKHGAVVNSLIGICNAKEDCSLDSKVSSKVQIQNQGKSSEEVLSSIQDVNRHMELHGSKIPETRDEIGYQANQISGNHRAWSLPDRTTLEIVIDNDDRQNNQLTEETPKEKGFKIFFWKSRGENHPRAKGYPTHSQMNMINWINQHLRGGRRCQRQQQMPPVLRVNSRQFILTFVLTIFLCLFCSTRLDPCRSLLMLSSRKIVGW